MKYLPLSLSIVAVVISLFPLFTRITKKDWHPELLEKSTLFQLNKITILKTDSVCIYKYTATVSVFDSINNEYMYETVQIPKDCYDTLKIGGIINYFGFNFLVTDRAIKELRSDVEKYKSNFK